MRNAGRLVVGGALLAAVTALTSPAASATTVPAPTVTLLGSGYGHGVGLSQYGALGQAENGATAAQIVQHYFTGAALTAVDDSALVYVNLLHQVASATFRTVPLATGGGTLQVVIDGYGTVSGGAGDVWTVTTTASGLVLKRTVAGVSTSYPAAAAVAVRWAGTRYLGGPATLLDLAGPGESTSDSAGRYPHGALELRLVAGRLEVADVLRLHDEYLDGVAEMPSSWSAAAVQAQAIASRTFALHAYAAGLSTGCDCHLYDTTTSQVYAGWAKEGEAGGLGARWVAAVAATAPSATTGLALLSGGAPISAFFTSSTGGVTRSSQSVWGGVLPYAVSVDDHWSLNLSVNPLAAWSVTVTADRLRQVAFPTLPDLARFQLTSFAPDGTLATATGWSSGGASATTTGAQLASGLGLRSRWVTSFLTTLTNSPPPAVDVKSVQGHRASGGREWQTWCEPYSTGVQRCWVYIKASTVVSTASGYAVVYGWVFNNLTYRGTWSAGWDSTLIAVPGDHVINGRQWRVTCTPAATGPRVCTAYIWAYRTAATPLPGGGYTFRTYATWVYNDQVVLTAPS